MLKALSSDHTTSGQFDNRIVSADVVVAHEGDDPKSITASRAVDYASFFHMSPDGKKIPSGHRFPQSHSQSTSHLLSIKDKGLWAPPQGLLEAAQRTEKAGSWQAYVDPVNKNPFWVNHTTKEITFHAPASHPHVRLAKTSPKNAADAGGKPAEQQAAKLPLQENNHQPVLGMPKSKSPGRGPLACISRQESPRCPESPFSPNLPHMPHMMLNPEVLAKGRSNSLVESPTYGDNAQDNAQVIHGPASDPACSSAAPLSKSITVPLQEFPSKKDRNCLPYSATGDLPVQDLQMHSVPLTPSPNGASANRVISSTNGVGSSTNSVEAKQAPSSTGYKLPKLPGSRSGTPSSGSTESTEPSNEPGRSCSRDDDVHSFSSLGGLTADPALAEGYAPQAPPRFPGGGCLVPLGSVEGVFGKRGADVEGEIGLC